jgi:hypothetical protein
MERRCTFSGQEKDPKYSGCTSLPLRPIHDDPPRILTVPPPSRRISNDKPSAIFRVKSTYADDASSAAYTKFAAYSTPATVQNVNVTAILGLSVEPLPQIQEQLQVLQQQLQLQQGGAEALRNPAVLAERIVKHLINYIAGFTGGVNPNTMMPVSLIEKWYETFMRKLQAGGVGFLERGE